MDARFLSSIVGITGQSVGCRVFGSGFGLGFKNNGLHGYTILGVPYDTHSIVFPKTLLGFIIARGLGPIVTRHWSSLFLQSPKSMVTGPCPIR